MSLGMLSVVAEGAFAANFGTLGWRISHKRQQGGLGKIFPVWQHWTGLNLVKPRCKPQRFFLCKICHFSGRYISTFNAVNVYSAIRKHLLTHHKIGRDSERLPIPVL